MSLAILIVAGIMKGIMDTLQFHYDKSFASKFKNQQWWNPKLSWKNKYKDRGDSFIVNLFEKIDNTFFVFVTDAWHLSQSIMITAMIMAIVLYQPITPYILLDILILRVSFGIGFKLSYK